MALRILLRTIVLHCNQIVKRFTVLGNKSSFHRVLHFPNYTEQIFNLSTRLTALALGTLSPHLLLPLRSCLLRGPVKASKTSHCSSTFKSEQTRGTNLRLSCLSVHPSIRPPALLLRSVVCCQSEIGNIPSLCTVHESSVASSLSLLESATSTNNVWIFHLIYTQSGLVLLLLRLVVPSSPPLHPCLPNASQAGKNKSIARWWSVPINNFVKSSSYFSHTWWVALSPSLSLSLCQLLELSFRLSLYLSSLPGRQLCYK